MPDVPPADSRAGRDIRKGAITVVAIKNVGAEIGHEEICFAVIIEIGCHTTEAPAFARNARLLSHVRKRAVAVVAKQVIVVFARGHLPLQFFDGRPVHQVKIHVAVIVVVEPASTAAVDLEDVFFFATAGNDDRSDSCFLRHITEMDRRLIRNQGQQHNGAARDQQQGHGKQSHCGSFACNC